MQKSDLPHARGDGVPCPPPQPALAGGRTEARSKVSSPLPAFQTGSIRQKRTPLLRRSRASEKMLLSVPLMPLGAAAWRGWLKTPFCWDRQPLRWQPLPTRLD